VSEASASRILALPLHGEAKLRAEGMRTRDAHLLEWMARLRPGLEIELHSRAEPWPRVSLARRRGGPLPPGFRCVSPQPLTLPPLRDRKRWWAISRRHAAPYPETGVDAVISWNPFAALPADASKRPLLFDLLDDMLIHPEFASIRAEAEGSYRRWLGAATLVTANSEATLELARSFGRDDATLVLNGCDPERFSTEHRPGDEFTVGYGGKVSERLDVELVRECAARLPGVRFEFVGQILSRRVRGAVAGLPNIEFVGDVAYPDYPATFHRWDIAWVPHRVGAGETGGDLLKLYEYRAAGLPTVSTRVGGWERAAAGVEVLDRERIAAKLAELAAGGPGSVPRLPHQVPAAQTWSHKAGQMLAMLGV
jgi:glycosyltransferase involved in cell wall biosynthesis